MNRARSLIQQTHRLRRGIRRWVTFPIKVIKLLSKDHLPACLEKVRNRLNGGAGGKLAADRYARWRSESESPVLSSSDGTRVCRLAVLILSVSPPAEQLERVLNSIVGQSGADGAIELFAVIASEDPTVRQVVTLWADANRSSAVSIIDSAAELAPTANRLLARARTEYVLLMDSDCLLAGGALGRFALAKESRPECDIVYCDHDTLDKETNRVDPFFKPDCSPELLHSFNYIGSVALVRASLLRAVGGFRDIRDRAFTYDVLLRALEYSTRVHHVREVLYHRRLSGPAMQPIASLEVVSSALARRGATAHVVAAGRRTECRFERTSMPLVSIVIPSDDTENSLDCIARLLRGTAYPEFEVLLITNSAVARKVQAACADDRVRCVIYDGPFNFSDKCNAGASAARGEFFIFFNDDVAPLTADWIERLLDYAELPGIGGVSPKMLYETGRIQYAGMVTGVRDFVGTAFHCWEADDERYHGLVNCVRNVSILCGACMMVSRAAFEEIGGWDARNTPIAHSDLSFSFDLTERGYRLVYTPLAEMRHVGAKSRQHNVTWRHLDDEAHYFVMRRYGIRLSDDPYFPPGMRAMVYADRLRFQLFAPNTSPAVLSTQPRRILLITHELSLSGAPMVVLELGRHLMKNGWGVCVVSPRDGMLRESFEHSGIPVIIDEGILSNPRASSHLWASFDLVVPNTVLGWKCVQEAVRLGTPNVFLVHESDFGVKYIESQWPAARKAFAVADAVVFSSAKTLRLYEDYRGSASHFEIRYGVHDVAAQVRRSLPTPSDGKVRIMHSGMVERRKAQDLLVEAVSRLPKSIRDQLDVHFVGRDNDPLGAEFVSRVKQKARGLPVHFTGEIPRDEALAYLAASDILVCTSKEETGPLVVYEAMAMGKPVITTRVGAAAQIVADGESGFVIDVGDVDALCDRLTKLVLAGDAARQRLGSSGRRIFEKELTIDRTGAQLCALFEQVLAKRGISRRPTSVQRAA